jgi:SAM-dependent methyltransferase
MFYGPDQAAIHDNRFGTLARYAAADVIGAAVRAGHRCGTVVDLGCGSGILARAVGDAGYDLVGIDISADMIALAEANAPRARLAVGSLHDFPIPSGCVAVATTGEALNYAADPRAGLAAMQALAARVFAALAPGGSWLFDVSGPGRAGPTGVAKQFFRYPDWCLGMTATESEDRSRLDREITTFVLEDGGRYRRTEEHHVLILYRPEEIMALLQDAGFELSILGDYRSPPVALEQPGWYVVEARKPV